MTVRAAVVLFTRDLRVQDHPPLATAAREFDRVVPLFVFDDGILKSDFARPNRVAFLRESLNDLDDSVRKRGGRLVLRSGDVVFETMRVVREVAAEAIFVSADASGYAQERERRLERASEDERVQLRVFPGVTCVVDDVTTKAGSHFSVFTPYYRAWRQAPLRPVEKPPRRLSFAANVSRGHLPALRRLVTGMTSPELPRGGETAGRQRLTTWIRGGLERYEERRDDLATDGTSRLSPYLHFGCLSPREIVERVAGSNGGEVFARQLAWRDFFCQLLEARPETSRENMRDRRDRWREDPVRLAAWKEGRTGYPIVDAGMRQLLLEGFMHNRARLVTASFLTKDLYLDWREGAAHYFDWLVDGDVANNVGNWQWVAGTGADTRPNRIFNPTRQAKRFDRDGAYVRRYVPELRGIDGAAVHEPWKLPAEVQARLDYPDPIVDHDEAAARLRRRRRS